LSVGIHWLVRGFEINLETIIVMVHVVVKWDNLWVLINISNTNQWKTYIIEALGRGRPFDILVQFHIKPQIVFVTAEEEEQPKVQDEGRVHEGEKDELEWVVEGTIDENHIPVVSWGFVVLAVTTYRGLYKASTRMSLHANLTGCPLLLQLWSYERICSRRHDVGIQVRMLKPRTQENKCEKNKC
jgi:hypothetical protein